VPAGKLFSVERTVSQLLDVMENLEEGDSGQGIDLHKDLILSRISQQTFTND
jgi:hypothetical protein